ncbi:hypothetical protein HKX48_001702 [Thoreauomyces humboldtii]|nr:hypothetical protein HKX48_001702 [Thoreauomyces humboldtii]
MGQILVRLAILTFTPELERMSDVVMGRTAEGKPILVLPPNRNDLAFNVSHHGAWVVVAAAATADPLSLRLGVDVSQVQPLCEESVDEYFEAFQDFFTEAEWTYVHGDALHAAPSKSTPQDRMHRFHHLWCLKESYVKALGIGLGMDLERICFSVEPTEANPHPQSTLPAKISMALDGEQQKRFHFELAYLDCDHPVAICCELDIRPAASQFTILRWDSIKERIAALGDNRFAVCC